jgi:RimJ/RimL family protein N-acetyltransferase
MLTPLREDDSPTLFRWINDRELVTLSAPFEPVSEEAHRRWFEDVRARDDVEIWAIRIVEGERLIGSCQLREIDPGGRRAELQIRIGEREAWGKGFGTEAVELLVRHAFEDLGLRWIELQVFATNRRAIRAYERAGFTRQHLLREAVEIDGRKVDVVMMAVQRPSAAV